MPTQVGNKTECALLGFLQRLGRNYEDLRRQHPESEFVKVFTFSSARRSMSTIIHTPEDDTNASEVALQDKNPTSKLILITKGAAEMIISK